MRSIAFAVLRGVMVLLFGLSVGHRERLPGQGPAILAANHNSHLDILLLLASLPSSALKIARPVGAEDYFFRTPFLRFVAAKVLRVVPVERRVQRGSDALGPARAALADGAILIVFPEGTRGSPEEMGALKSGVTKLAAEAGAKITPVYVQGAGRILPKGARVPVPYTVSVLVGEAINVNAGERAEAMAALEAEFAGLREAAPPLYWN